MFYCSQIVRKPNGRADYNIMHVHDGTIFPMAITMGVSNPEINIIQLTSEWFIRKNRGSTIFSHHRRYGTDHIFDLFVSAEVECSVTAGHNKINYYGIFLHRFCGSVNYNYCFKLNRRNTEMWFKELGLIYMLYAQMYLANDFIQLMDWHHRY